MDKIGLNNYNNRINFGGIQATQKGARKLVTAFQDRDMDFLKNAIALAKNNTSADILVKENEILVKPHELTNYGTMRMRDITENRDVLRVDYFEHDVHSALNYGCYTIDNNIPKVPYLHNYECVGFFGKLFEGACRIAEDLDVKFHDKIISAIEKEKKLDDIVNTLDLDIIDK